jgi:hypothetical protein
MKKRIELMIALTSFLLPLVYRMRQRVGCTSCTIGRLPMVPIAHPPAMNLNKL